MSAADDWDSGTADARQLMDDAQRARRANLQEVSTPAGWLRARLWRHRFRARQGLKRVARGIAMRAASAFDRRRR